MARGTRYTPLEDGEVRKIFHEYRRDSIHRKGGDGPTVIAERIDCDTPYIHLQFMNGRHTLTDTEVRILIGDLEHALRVLPTSK